MHAVDIIQEIQQLPLTKKFYIIEETLKAIKKEEMKNQMQIAAAELYDEYFNNSELTVFTSLDFETFYETR